MDHDDSTRLLPVRSEPTTKLPKRDVLPALTDEYGYHNPK